MAEDKLQTDVRDSVPRLELNSSVEVESSQSKPTIVQVSNAQKRADSPPACVPLDSAPSAAAAAASATTKFNIKANTAGIGQDIQNMNMEKAESEPSLKRFGQTCSGIEATTRSIKARQFIANAASRSKYSLQRALELGNIRIRKGDVEDDNNIDLVHQVHRASLISTSPLHRLARPLPGTASPKFRFFASKNGKHGSSIAPATILDDKQESSKAAILEPLSPRASGSSFLENDDLRLLQQQQHQQSGVNKFRIVMEADAQNYRWVIDWDNPYRRAWDVLIVGAVVYLCFLTPLQIAFVEFEYNKTFSSFLDYLFWMDILLNFRTGFIHRGEHEKNPRKIAAHYLESWFFIDIFASIPFELFFGASSKTTRKSLKILKWLKIPKLLRVGRIFKYLKRYIKFYRVFLLVSLGVLLTHLMCCFWLTIMDPCIFLDEDEDIPVPPLAMYDCSQLDMWRLYLLGLRVSVSMLFLLTDPFAYVANIDRGIWEEEQVRAANVSTISNVTSCSSTTQNVSDFGYASEAWSLWTHYDNERRHQVVSLCLFTPFCMCIGLALTLNFIAEAVVFASNRMASYYEFYNRVDRIKREMAMLHLPEEIQYRVSQYFDYLWINQKMGLNDQSGGLLRDPDLSLPLRKDLALLMHGPLLSQVSLFRDCSNECLFRLAMSLTTHVYLPGDIVFNKGDLARELYMIRKGVIAVLFGEMDEGFQQRIDLSAGAARASMQDKLAAETKAMAQSEFSVDETLKDSATVKLMGPGSFFGEIALLTSLPRSCSVLSKTVSELNKLSRADFERCMKDFPELSDDIADEVLKLYPGLEHHISEFLASTAALRGTPPSPRYSEDQQQTVSRNDVEDIVQSAIERLALILGGENAQERLHSTTLFKAPNRQTLVQNLHENCNTSREEELDHISILQGKPSADTDFHVEDI